MKVVCDIDGVLCENGPFTGYATVAPIQDMIDRLNNLFNAGDHIVLHTSRLDADREVTERWLRKHKVSYHTLVLGKPSADLYIDDKAEQWLPNYTATLDRKPLVICYSGGMDSLIAYYWALMHGYVPEDITLLNFDIGHPYAKKEQDALAALGLPFQTVKIDWPAASSATVDKYIITARNLVFASLAAGYGERVWIVGVKFEDHPKMFDKNKQFYRTATLAASQACGARTFVETPFANMSKTDMLVFANEVGILDQVHKTVSCYHPTIPRCGNCGLCFKRAIAIRAAGLEIPLHEYAENPLTCKAGAEFVKLYKTAVETGDFSHYSEDRINETMTALGL